MGSEGDAALNPWNNTKREKKMGPISLLTQWKDLVRSEMFGSQDRAQFSHLGRVKKLGNLNSIGRCRLLS